MEDQKMPDKSIPGGDAAKDEISDDKRSEDITASEATADSPADSPAENPDDSPAESPADESPADSLAKEPSPDEKSSDEPAKKPAINKKRLIILLCAAAAVLLAAFCGVLIWRSASAPKAPLNMDQPEQALIKALYREKSKRKDEIPPRLNDMLGEPEDDRLTPNGNESLQVVPPFLPGGEENASGRKQIAEREWILTDLETYDKLHTDLSMQYSLQVRALIKLALVQNCERVQYSIEYVTLPQGEIATIEQYLAARAGEGSVRGEGGYTLEFSADWANSVLGKDVKALAKNRTEFDAFMKELETYTPQPALVLPGSGR